MKKIIFTILIGLLFFSPLTTNASTETEPVAQKNIDVYIFTQQGCIHCVAVKSLLDELKQKEYPGLTVHEFDLRTNPEYFKQYVEFGKAYKSLDARGAVPVTYVGEKVVHGAALSDIRGIIEICNIKECKNPQTIVNEYLKINPDAIVKNTGSTATTVGVVVIIILVIGGIIVFVTKK